MNDKYEPFLTPETIEPARFVELEAKVDELLDTAYRDQARRNAVETMKGQAADLGLVVKERKNPTGSLSFLGGSMVGVGFGIGEMIQATLTAFGIETSIDWANGVESLFQSIGGILFVVGMVRRGDLDWTFKGGAK